VRYTNERFADGPDTREARLDAALLQTFCSAVVENGPLTTNLSHTLQITEYLPLGEPSTECLFAGKGETPESSSHSPNHRFVIALHSPDGILQTGLRVGPPEKRAAKLPFKLHHDTFSESVLGAIHAELRGFSALFRERWQSFSAAETCWRSKVDSNSKYILKLRAKTLCVSHLRAFHQTGERNWAGPCDRVVRFLWRFNGEGLAIAWR
jgi:hypothetical protein